MRLTPMERWLIIVGCVMAVVVGGFFGYVAYFLGAEAQFHGGVLPEDEAEAFWGLVLETAVAFVKAAALSLLLIPALPVALRRLWPSIRELKPHE